MYIYSCDLGIKHTVFQNLHIKNMFNPVSRRDKLVFRIFIADVKFQPNH